MEDGGPQSIFAWASEGDRTRIFSLPAFDGLADFLSDGRSLWAALVGGCFLTMATHATDHDMVQRLLAARDGQRGARALFASAVLNLPLTALFLSIGTGLAWFYANAEVIALPPGDGRSVLAFFARHELAVGLRGLVFAGVFAAAMSSLDSAICAIVATVLRDLTPDGEYSQRRTRAASVWVTGGLVATALAMAVYAEHGLGGALNLVELALSAMTIVYGGTPRRVSSGNFDPHARNRSRCARRSDRRRWRGCAAVFSGTGPPQSRLGRNDRRGLALVDSDRRDPGLLPCGIHTREDDMNDRAGEHLWIGIPGPRVDDETRRQLEAIRPGGIVLFERNIVDRAQVHELCAELRRLMHGGLRIAVDQEGGRIRRFGCGVSEMPSAAELGERARVDLESTLREVEGRCEVAARELHALGVDVNFAPVADLDANPQNPALRERCFGSDPERVAALVAASVTGYLRGGVRPTLKHFPGLGGAANDPHDVMARIDKALRPESLIPFRAGIAAGAPLVMTTHVVVAGVDELPATFSERIVRRLLRGELDFRGQIITDALEMGAIAGDGNAAVVALRAGHDLICLGRADFEWQRRIHASLSAALAEP